VVVSCTFSSFSSVVARRLASEIFFWKPVKISQNYVREFVASLLWSILYISPARLSQTGSECGSRSDAVIYHSPVTLSGRQYFVTKWPSSRGDVDYLGLRLQPTLMDIATAKSAGILGLGLPDLPYFTGDPVFQPRSPASRKEAARETESPVFDYRLIQIGRMTAFDYLYILIFIMTHCFGFQMWLFHSL